MLVILFLSYYISTVAFYHTHYFNWGTVTHSHPYFPFDKDSANHTHTPIECQTISLLSNLVLAVAVAAVFFSRPIIIQKIYVWVRSFVSHSQLRYFHLRAPPVFICK